MAACSTDKNAKGGLRSFCGGPSACGGLICHLPVFTTGQMAPHKCVGQDDF